jgi:hypothetical protein
MHRLALILIGFLLFSARGDERPAILQIIDGSLLHGSVQAISKTNGLHWAYPAAKEPMQLLFTNLASIRFERAQAPSHSFKPACRFEFRNGDELMGNTLDIKDQKLRFQSWFGESVEADLKSLDTITFSARGYNLLYEGPTDTNGWRIGRNPRSWEYRDGAFIANGADLLGRNFGLTGSSTLEFDLAWNGQFSLSITLYAEVIDRFDYSTSAYLVYLGTGAISVQRVQAGAGAVMLGQTQVPEMLRKNKMHFEIRANKEDATISLFADGKFIQRWKDPSAGGFVAKGGGLVFFSQVEPRKLALSNIRVAEWDGRFEPEGLTNAPPELDVVFLANRDKVFGKILSLDDGKTTVETKQTKLDIPLGRITQIRFAKTQTETNSSPQEVRVLFPGGEKIVFDLEKWDGEEVTGSSKTFGALTFHPKHIRELQFNLERTALGSEPPQNLDTEFLETK